MCMRIAVNICLLFTCVDLCARARAHCEFVGIVLEAFLGLNGPKVVLC